MSTHMAAKNLLRILLTIPDESAPHYITSTSNVNVSSARISIYNDTLSALSKRAGKKRVDKDMEARRTQRRRDTALRRVSRRKEGEQEEKEERGRRLEKWAQKGSMGWDAKERELWNKLGNRIINIRLPLCQIHRSSNWLARFCWHIYPSNIDIFIKQMFKKKDQPPKCLTETLHSRNAW